MPCAFGLDRPEREGGPQKKRGGHESCVRCAGVLGLKCFRALPTRGSGGTTPHAWRICPDPCSGSAVGLGGEHQESPAPLFHQAFPAILGFAVRNQVSYHSLAIIRCGNRVFLAHLLQILGLSPHRQTKRGSP